MTTVKGPLNCITLQGPLDPRVPCKPRQWRGAWLRSEGHGLLWRLAGAKLPIMSERGHCGCSTRPGGGPRGPASDATPGALLPTRLKPAVAAVSGCACSRGWVQGPESHLRLRWGIVCLCEPSALEAPLQAVPGLRVSIKEALHKRACLRRRLPPLLALGDSQRHGGRVPVDEVCPALACIEGELAAEHHVHHHAQPPVVHHLVIVVFLHDLRGHESRCADLVAKGGLVMVACVPGQPEVADLDGQELGRRWITARGHAPARNSLVHDEDVVELQVAVDHPVLVHVADGT
mmetsp:Transcript_92267/g.238129  ORF Transcript_92267/g.238129 Transcript_92267/m.238129 type:complete len:290 (+) Transcript_92267:458-1327(+)